jgi:hypothetical protein
MGENRTVRAGGDGGYRLHGAVDVVERVVEVEAQAAARGRVQAERVMGERRAVAACARFHPGPVQGLRDGDRIMTREVERDQRGTRGWVLRTVDGDPRDGAQALERAGGQAAVPGRHAVHGRMNSAAFDGFGRLEVGEVARCRRQVEQDAQGLR